MDIELDQISSKRRFSRKKSLVALDKYNQFKTIDWMQKRQKSPETFLMGSILSLETWLLLTCIGILTGLLASYIDISIAFLSDFKRGIIGYLSKDICCQSLEREKDYCLDYIPWSSYLLSSSGSSSIISGGSDSMGSSGNSTAITATFSLDPSTINIDPSTINIDPSTINIDPSTINIDPSTINIDPSTTFNGMILDFIWYITSSILFATTSTFLVSSLTILASGSGISEIKTILGGFQIKDFLSTKVFIVKTIALPLAIGSGLLLGKEAVLVHLAGCLASGLFNKFGGYRGDYARQIEVLSCSSAAGIAVAFGAPIGRIVGYLSIGTYRLMHYIKLYSKQNIN
jgi:H+/Cl- antiporter ClcA